MHLSGNTLCFCNDNFSDKNLCFCNDNFSGKNLLSIDAVRGYVKFLVNFSRKVLRVVKSVTGVTLFWVILNFY